MCAPFETVAFFIREIELVAFSLPLEYAAAIEFRLGLDTRLHSPKLRFPFFFFYSDSDPLNFTVKFSLFEYE